MQLKIRKYSDESTTEKYEFRIYCEHCGKLVLDHSSAPGVCYKPKLFISASKRRAKELLWLSGHEKAFREAVKEASPKLSRCEVCGNIICDDCAVINNDLGGRVCCKKCLSDLAHANKKCI